MHLREWIGASIGALALALLASLIGVLAKKPGEPTTGSSLAPRLAAVSTWSMRVAWAASTIFMASRWLVWKEHPPWGSVYECLMAFGWSILTAWIYFDFRHRVRAGILVPALAILVNVMAWTAPYKGIPGLSPSFHSALLYLHPPLGILAFGSFTLAAAFGFLFLLRDRVRTEVLLFAGSVLVASFLPFAGGKDFYGSHVALALGWAAFGGFAAHVFLSSLWLLFPIPAGKPSPSTWLASPGEKIDLTQLILRLVYVLSLLCLVGACLALLPMTLAAGREASAGIGGGRDALFGACGVFGLGGIGLFLALPLRFRPGIEAGLPSAAVLDRCGYQAMIFGFLGTGLCLFLGMLWAFLVWGRYWGWDSKEVWTLALWVYAGIYLMSRQTLRPGSRVLAVMACGGFLLMLFAFLGVNLLLTTQHGFPTG